MDADEFTISRVIAANVRTVRDFRGMSAARLGARCAELGMPSLDGGVIAKIEAPRTARRVLADELVVLAQALEVSIGALAEPDGTPIGEQLGDDFENPLRWLVTGRNWRGALGDVALLEVASETYAELIRLATNLRDGVQATSADRPDDEED